MNAIKARKFLIFVIFTVGLVILWGAYVRATGSGAGCGRHWPLCNGEVIPREPAIQTLIEFSHRVSSGLSFILVIIGGTWAYRSFPINSFGRKMAIGAIASMILEALIGAFLVLFRLVTDNQSLLRTVSICLHFSNTLLLLTTLTLTTTALARNGRSWTRWTEPFRREAMFYGISFLLLGMAGAITALGDTLFPASSLAQGIRDDWSSASHFLVRLRFIHPVIASWVAISMSFWVYRNFRETSPNGARWGMALITLLNLNLVLGMLNLVFLAPIAIQMIHLGIAISAWVTFVLFIDERVA